MVKEKRNRKKKGEGKMMKEKEKIIKEESGKGYRGTQGGEEGKGEKKGKERRARMRITHGLRFPICLRNCSSSDGKTSWYITLNIFNRSVLLVAMTTGRGEIGPGSRSGRVS